MRIPLVLLLLLPLGVQAFRPPTVPLVQCDPFFSVWSRADRLTDVETTHWSGAKQPISVTLTADGTTWRLCGAEPAQVPALPQTGVEVRPTQTVCTFEKDGLKVTLVWSTAKLPENLEAFSRPVTYVTARVTGAKAWRLDASISPALATNDDAAEMVTNRCTVAGLPACSIGRKVQKPLGERGDRVRCNWGSAWLVGPSAAKDGEAHVLLAYDDVVSLSFIERPHQAWWRRNGLAFPAMLAQAEAERPALLAKLDAFDAEFTADLRRLGGEKYATLAALAYRQSFAACKLVADRNGQPLYFSKENTSNGCMGTVDLIYPQSPHLLLMSPTLMRASLAPILIYASSPRWPWPFAPHDVGQYPLGDKQCYGGGETAKDDRWLMPVEESGNMLICLCALARLEGTADFASDWWPTLTRWAEYLAKFGFDPGDQLCTDDFAGHLAHNANLAIKAILGLASYAKMAEMRGEKDVAARFRNLAKEMVPKWCEAAKGGRAGGYRLAYDQPDTWSMKYNLVWDRILGFNLFPSEVAKTEMKAYRTLLRPYGLALDSRKAWTKSDWLCWTATLTGARADFDLLMDGLYRFADETPDRHPFSDWFWTDSGHVKGFLARSVIGGLFIPALYDPALWRKWASRDRGTTGLYAPVEGRRVIRAKSVVPEGRASADIQWRYTFDEPPAGWERPDFDDSSWKRGAGGFGGGGAPGTTVRTPWKTPKIWLRRHVTLAQVPREPLLSMHHDEDTTVWFNGVRAGVYAGYTVDYGVFEVTPEAAAALKPGDNVIASVTSQTAGGQYIDWGLSEALAGQPIKVIFDTDMKTDYDDIGALAMLHALADAGECDLLAVVQSSRGNAGLAVVEIVNQYYGRPNLPLGALHAGGVRHPGDARAFNLLEKYAGSYRYRDSAHAPAAVDVLRKTLAEQPDGSVVVCAVGFMTNLRDLLRSKGDRYSPLDGRALVAKKVKRAVIMACSYPNGKEHNSRGDWQASKTTFEEWPTPIVFTDFQYGANVYAGRAVAELMVEGNPVKDAFAYKLPPRAKVNARTYDRAAGHPSWDETAVLAAVRPLERYFNVERGTYRMVGTEGDDEWVADEKSANCRLTVKMSKEDVGKAIDELMCRPPRLGR